MNKKVLILLSILGGIDVSFYLATPIILVGIWASISGFNHWTDYLLFIIGLLSTIFRAIKVGFLKN